MIIPSPWGNEGLLNWQNNRTIFSLSWGYKAFVSQNNKWENFGKVVNKFKVPGSIAVIL